MARTALQRVSSFALYSRILVIVMQVFFNYLMPDHSSDAFNPPSVHRVGRMDWWMRIFLDGFKRWDSIYFLHIAEHGYTYENTLAFCPGFPILVSLLSNSLLLPLHYIMNETTILLIAAVLLNVYFFVKSAKALYLLSERVLGDETLALKTAQLYCINPASIFFSAAYSEALFAFVTFNGLFEFEKRNLTRASLLFGLSGLVRANGLVNAGFIVYHKAMDFVQQLTSPKWKDMVDMKTTLFGIISLVFLTVPPLIFYIILCLLPFIGYQLYAYSIFCNTQASYKDLPSHILNYGNNHDYHMPHAGLSLWCHHRPPLSYSYVQAKHWDNGFLNYYETKQIPNFLLAAPMIIICVSALVCYARHNVKRFMSLGLGQREFYKKYDEEKTEATNEDQGFFSMRAFVYVAHLAGLLTVAVFFMHIQVTTRFIACASPAVYWFIATTTTPADQLRPRHNPNDVTRKPTPPQQQQQQQHQHGAGNGDAQPAKTAVNMDIIDWDKTNVASKAIFIYFHLYFFVGVAAFANFLPWT